MKRSNRFYAALPVAVFLSILLIACKKEKEILTESTPSTEESVRPGKWASAQIAASEKLVIPAAVDLPENSERVATYYAIGVQKYRSRVKAGSSPAVLEWYLAGPDAKLYDASSNEVGHHGFGPFWTVSPTDSIFAQHFAPARTAPSPDPGSIDWLLLKPKAGTTPTGIFAGVDYIQRIGTKGGKAPLTAPASLTDTIDVKYKTVYRFSKQN